jgi:hypothetical protein
MDIDSGPWYHAVIMAKEFPKRIDISDVPALVKLAEEVRTSNRPAVLLRGSEELALLTPRRKHSTPHVPALADPDDIWADYDPEHVKQALVDSAGIFKDLDRDAFLADLKEQGQQDSSGRPIDG